GKNGNAAAMKLVGNLIVALEMEALAEGLVLAQKAGLNLNTVMEVVKVADFRSPLLVSNGQNILKRDFSPSFALKLMLKDARLIEKFGESVQSPIPALRVAEKNLASAVALGFRTENASALIKALVLMWVVTVAATATLIFGCERSAKKASSQLPLIPETDPLAQPKSLQQVGAPVAMTRAAIPADNQQTPEKISLGQKLFFDRRLSVNGTVSCSTCHDPALAFTDRKPTSVGVQGRVGQRNAPTVLNALYNKTQFWDGRVNTLEEQAALPIVNSVEMGHPNLDAAVAQIATVEEYQQAFRVVF
ncbi:MAG: hypothetical protein DMG15_16310, partial [Acidobacteria bacterium]